MRRRRTIPEMFSLSFVDCIASSLGSLMILVLVLAAVGRQEARIDAEETVVITASVVQRSADGGERPEPCSVGLVLIRGDQPVPLSNSNDLRDPRDGSLLARRVDVYENHDTGASQVWLRQAASGDWTVQVTAWRLEGHPAVAAKARVEIRVRDREPLTAESDVRPDFDGSLTAFRFSAAAGRPSETVAFRVPPRVTGR